MTREQETYSDAEAPHCRRCSQPINLRSEADCLDKFGTFTRLRCPVPECGHEDWYKDVKLPKVEALPKEHPAGPGEIWIHDVMLGLSFRAESR